MNCNLIKQEFECIDAIVYLSQAGCRPGVLGFLKSIGILMGCLLGVLKTYISFGGGSHLFCFLPLFAILAIVLIKKLFENIFVLGLSR